MKTRVLLAIVVVLAVIAFSACSKAPRDEGQILHRGLPSEPESLDPHKGRTTQAAEVQRDIGEGLLSYSATGELVAGAAQRWEVSDQGTTYTFHLRPEARWSNGDAVIADHFVSSLRRLVTPETAAFYAEFLGDLVNAEDIVAGSKAPETLGVEAVDDLTLRLFLDKPVPYMLNLLTHPSTFPIHPGSMEEHGEAFVRPGNLLSNGAYVLEDWVPGQSIVIRRNEHYWNNAETAIDRVVYHVLVQPMAELNRYRAGDLHITSNVPPDAFEAVKAQYPDELKSAQNLGVYFYGYNLTKPPFKDSPELRQALSMAIDRDMLTGKIIGRGEKPAYSWVVPGVANYEPTVMSFASLTQEERNIVARRLYAEAGYGPDNPLEVELRYNTSDFHRRVAVAIQAMWRDALGFEVTLVNEEAQVLIANIREREVTQIFRLSWIGDYPDAHTFLSIMQSGAPTNTPGYSNPEYDSLMERAASQPDLDRRRLYLEEAERVLLADHAVIPLYFFVSERLVSLAVGGWEDNVLDYHYSQHLSLSADE